MNDAVSRRTILRAAGFSVAAALLPVRAATALKHFASPSLPTTPPPPAPPIRLGLASYTFRNFARAQMIGFMKHLNVTDLNVKDVKDHLPMDPAAEAQALADYAAAGIKLHAAGAIYFPKDDDADIRAKFEYCKARRHPASSSPAIPRPTRCRASKTSCKRIRHPHRHPQPRPRRQVLALAPRRPQGHQRHGPAHRLLHRRRPRRPRRRRRRRGHPRRRPAPLQHAHEGPHQLHRQGKPGRGGRRHNAGPRNIRGASSRSTTPASSTSNTKSTPTIRCPASSRASRTCAAF